MRLWHQLYVDRNYKKPEMLLKVTPLDPVEPKNGFARAWVAAQECLKGLRQQFEDFMSKWMVALYKSKRMRLVIGLLGAAATIGG